MIEVKDKFMEFAEKINISMPKLAEDAQEENILGNNEDAVDEKSTNIDEVNSLDNTPVLGVSTEEANIDETLYTVDSSSISQVSEDAKYIKEKISFIKPLSRYYNIKIWSKKSNNTGCTYLSYRNRYCSYSWNRYYISNGWKGYTSFI